MVGRLQPPAIDPESRPGTLAPPSVTGETDLGSDLTIDGEVERTIHRPSEERTVSDDQIPTIVALFTTEPLGSAVVNEAAEEARRRGGRLIVLDPRPNEEDPPRATQAARDAVDAVGDDLDVTLRAVRRERSNGTVAVWLADQVNAALLVIGMRRRSPVGKLVLGSGAQDALLGANCPVLAVKVPEDG